jgi:tetratricopeptide (TPR) repeat protein
MTNPKRYDEIGLAWGPTEDEMLPASQIVEEARGLAAEGEHRQAFEELLALASQAHETGLTAPAADLLVDLREIVDLRRVAPRERAWLYNLEGLTQRALGNVVGARRSFRQMLATGERLGDPHILSTAHQNIGVEALVEDRPDDAREHLLQAMELKQQIDDWYGFGQVAINLVSLLVGLERTDEAERLLDDIEPALKSAREPGLLSSAYGNRARLAVIRGRLDEAEPLHRRALDYARRAQDLGHEVVSLQNLGALSNDLGQPGRALRWYRRAIRVAETIGAPPQLHVLQRSLAGTLHRLGREREAVEAFAAARMYAEASGDRQHVAEATADLGAVLLTLGEHEHAEASLREALAAFRELGDAQWQADCLTNLSVSYQRRGKLEDAWQALTDAIAVLPAESQERRSELLRWAGEQALADPERRPLGPEYLRHSLVELEELERTHELASRTATAAALLRDRGLLDEALDLFSRALELYERLDRPHMAFHVRNDRAIVLTELRQFDEAQEDWRQCLGVARRRRDRHMRQQAYMNLGECLRRAGELGEAIRNQRRALRVARNLGDQALTAESLGNLGLALADADRGTEAEGAYKELRELAEATANAVAEATARGGLARLAFVDGQYEMAADLYSEAARLRREGDPVHVIEDLAGFVESLSAAGKRRGLKQAVQQLIDLAQEIGAEDDAALGLFRSARWFLDRGDEKQAAELSGIGAALAVSQLALTAADELDKETLLPVMKALGVLAHIVNEAHLDPEAFIARVSDEAGQYGEIEEVVYSLLKTSSETLREPASSDS